MKIRLNKFWRETTERAVKSAAQGGLLAIGADKLDVLSLDVRAFVGFALGGALLSVCTSLLSFKLGPSDSPSAV